MKKILTLLLVVFIAVAGLRPALAAESPYPLIESEAAVLMDAKTGQVLFAKNMHEELSPASITKIMTILLGIEHGQMDDTITMSREAVFSIEFGSSHIALDTGEKITLEQALMATMLASANEAANGIAEYVSGGIPEFVKLMNQRAREAGALHTHFVNPNGLYADDHLTTAYDMAMITRLALQNENFSRIFGTVKYEIPPTNKQPQIRYLWAEHKMFPGYRYQYDGMSGGKTGYTQKSENTLVTAARRGDRELIAVVIKSMNSAVYADTKALFDYGFNEFQAVPIALPAVTQANLTKPPADNLDDIQDMVNSVQEGENTRLIHKSLHAQDINIDYTCISGPGSEHPQLRVNLYLSKSSPYMYGDLGAITLGASPLVGPNRCSRWVELLVVIAKFAACFVGGVILLLFALKGFFTLRRRMRRKAKKYSRERLRGHQYQYELNQWEE